MYVGIKIRSQQRSPKLNLLLHRTETIRVCLFVCLLVCFETGSFLLLVQCPESQFIYIVSPFFKYLSLKVVSTLMNNILLKAKTMFKMCLDGAGLERWLGGLRVHPENLSLAHNHLKLQV